MSDAIKGHQEKSLNDLLDNVLTWNIFAQLNGTEVAKPYIQGRPGGGKTASLINMCEKYGWNLFHLHLPLIPIEDISGLPQFEAMEVNGEMVQGTRWTFPEILSEIYKLTNETFKDPKDNNKVKPKPCIVFLDDMHLASPSHLALGFELFSEKKLRTYTIPDNVAFVLAGNASQKAGTKSQNSAITNRLALYPIHTDFEHWKFSYAIPNAVNDKIIAFLSKETYKRFFHEDEVVNKAWGSPRSWTYLSNLLNLMENGTGGEVNPTELAYIANAHVSSSGASEFVAFYSIYSKTQMDKVFDGLKAVKAPESDMDKYIYMIAAGNEYVNRSKKDSIQKDRLKKNKLIEKLCEIACAIGDNNSEIAISGVKSILDTEQALNTNSKTTSYIDFARTLKMMKSSISAKLSRDIRKIAGAGV